MTRQNCPKGCSGGETCSRCPQVRIHAVRRAIDTSFNEGYTAGYLAALTKIRNEATADPVISSIMSVIDRQEEEFGAGDPPW